MTEPALYDLPTERAVLGIISSVSRTSVPEARVLVDSSGLSGADFSSPVHGILFGECSNLLATGYPVDSSSVTVRVGHRDDVERAGGSAFIAGVFEGDGYLRESFPVYAKAVRDLSLRRKVVSELKHGLAMAYDHSQDPGHTLGEVSGTLARMTRTAKTFRTLTDVKATTVTALDAVQRGEQSNVIPTGIQPLDKAIAGLPRAMVTVIGADTGVGKSAFLATIAEQIAARGTKVGIFSLEDEAEWLVYRVLSKRAKVDQFVLRYKKKTEFELDQIESGLGQLSSFDGKIFIDDRPCLTPEEIVLSARDMILNHDVDVIIIDHMGEVNVGRVGDRFDLQIAQALSQFRDLAKTHRIPVVVATQVTSSKDIQHGAVPGLRDFKNSREIANKCRVALGLGRAPGSDVMEIGILKQTNGIAGGTVRVEFIGAAAMLDTE